MFRIKRDSRSWEERQSARLKKLRAERIKMEGRAKLAKMEKNERARISRARTQVSGNSGIMGAINSAQKIASRINTESNKAYNRTYGKKKKKDPFDLGW